MVVVVVFVVVVNGDWGFLVLVGGGIFVIVNVVFVGCVFLFVGVCVLKMVVILFYMGEVLKIFIIIVLFFVVYMYM